MSVGSVGSTLPGGHVGDTGAVEASAAAAAGLTSERFSADPALAAIAGGQATLGIGARGETARSIQRALIDLGYDLGRAGADGIYGRMTASAVARFQRAAGLAASGTVDTATLAALDQRIAAFDRPPSPPPATTPGSGGATPPPPATTPPATTPPATPSASGLRSERFSADATLAAVAAGQSTLANGARGDAVKRVQLALGEVGFDLGRWGADGAYGGATASLITQFQRAAGLPATGTVDRATLAALDARVLAVDHPAPKALDEARLDSARFASDPEFQAVAQGTATIGRGARGAVVEKLQWTLVGLGFDHPRYGADGSFGGETETALRAFQRSSGLPETGRLDRTTLRKLDDDVAAKVAELKALSPAPEEKPLRYHVVTDLERCRIYVLEKGTEKPVASYLTSPGTTEFPTLGDRFTLQDTTVMGWWRPTGADWARNLDPAPPGIGNPMGLVKLSFGRYAEYFHGIPKSEEKDLGRAASHGCCRMSGANVLEFHERYAGPGTEVVLNRDRATSDDLARRFAEAGIEDRPISAGREYTAAYLYGEMGQNEKRLADGTIRVGGRG